MWGYFYNIMQRKPIIVAIDKPKMSAIQAMLRAAAYNWRAPCFGEDDDDVARQVAREFGQVGERA